MTAWNTYSKRPGACECRGDYDGEYLRCQVCGTANLEGRAHIQECVLPFTHGIDEGFQASLNGSHFSYGPTREVALTTLRKVMARKPKKRVGPELHPERSTCKQHGCLEDVGSSHGGKYIPFYTGLCTEHHVAANPQTEDTLPAERAREFQVGDRVRWGSRRGVVGTRGYYQGIVGEYVHFVGDDGYSDGAPEGSLHAEEGEPPSSPAEWMVGDEVCYWNEIDPKPGIVLALNGHGKWVDWVRDGEPSRCSESRRLVWLSRPTDGN